jgi:hypothetical protein
VIPTTRAQVAEEQYFRTQEAERREDQAWDRQRAALDAQVTRHREEASRVRQATASDGERHSSKQDLQRGLNRLVVTGWDECLAFEEATRLVQEPGQKSLRRKIERRGVFRVDLGAAIVSLGGVAASGCSPRARWLSWLRGAHRLLGGPHEGDAYAACFAAAERAEAAYSRALALILPEDVRFGVERQYAEVALDCQELRRLRWGARLTSATSQEAGQGRFPSLSASALPEPRDAQALEAWNNEGGASGKNGSTMRGAGPG